jgi:hypothetical protein
MEVSQARVRRAIVNVQRRIHSLERRRNRLTAMYGRIRMGRMLAARP